MTPLDVFELVNYGLVFVYGMLLSVSIAGWGHTRRELIMLIVTGTVLLGLQTASWLMFGTEYTMRLYPFITHLPLLLLLVLGLKKPVGLSLVCVCTAYLCCQLPRCGNIAIATVTGSELAGEIVYTVIIIPIFILLQRLFVPSAREAITESRKSLLLLGGLPVTFYLFAYAVYIYSGFIYSEDNIASEIMPTAVGLFYMVYMAAYCQQLHRRTQAELLNSLMSGYLKQAETEMASLRQAEAQTAAYQHDMRHHLAAIDGFLAAGKPQQAMEYIRQVRADIESITPQHFCENELVNLLCASFSAKAARTGVRLSLETSLPGTPAISDTALCALLSNGLENALNAAGALDEGQRWVDLYCGVRLDKLLIEIRNPYTGRLSFHEGLPTSSLPEHGHGCRSILTISQSCRGLCEFQADNGIFTLRVALPMLKG